ncbi:MAG: hypothetical protein QGG42_21865 [Phycisphaerae bacterium]|jgi:hypothetical protein|nr:hypothetical protein [Phycisphaerae bacterium]
MMRLAIRKTAWLCIAVALIAGCKQVDENPHWNPRSDYPAWAYDSPVYFRPSAEAKPVETVGKGIDVFYSRGDHFFVRHPGGSQLTGAARVAVWFSTDEGKNWETAGYFGVEQTHFLFQAEQDARHWVRFVGPGQDNVAKGPVPLPHRIHVVDRKAPEIAIAVRPSPWDDKEKKVPHIYKVGDEVSVGWAVRDINLAKDSIRLESCIGDVPFQLAWGRFRGALPKTGRRIVKIPPEAAREGAIRFRIEAEDKAGNVAAVMTTGLHVKRSKKSTGKQPTARPAGDFNADAPHKPARPGWPDAGSLIRCEKKQKLEWLPEAARNYNNIALQITTNNGLSWKTVAEKVEPGTPVIWTSPKQSSRFCRLRLIATDGDGQMILLAQSGMFRVSSPRKPTKIGPEKIRDFDGH